MNPNATVCANLCSCVQGTNIPGKKKEALNYSGGLPLYIQTINEVAERNWEGFVLSGGGTADKAAEETQSELLVHAESAVEHVEDVSAPQVTA